MTLKILMLRCYVAQAILVQQVVKFVASMDYFTVSRME